MKFYVYSIRDVRTGFLSPSIEVSDQVAKRNFEHAVSHSGSSLFMSHPEDYSLWCIGAFDSDTGVLEPCNPIGRIMEASDVLARMTGGLSDEV